MSDKNRGSLRSTVLADRRTVVRRLREIDVVRSAIFGSVARDESGPDSDIDLLVWPGLHTTPNALRELALNLEGRWKHPVHVVTPLGFQHGDLEKAMDDAIPLTWWGPAVARAKSQARLVRKTLRRPTE